MCFFKDIYEFIMIFRIFSKCFGSKHVTNEFLDKKIINFDLLASCWIEYDKIIIIIIIMCCPTLLFLKKFTHHIIN